MSRKTRALPAMAAAIALAAAALVGGASGPRAEGPNDLLIIANKSVRIDKISADELRAVFLKKKASIGGDKVVPINAKAGSGLRNAFQKRVVAMDGTSEAGFWEEQKIKAGLSPPAEFSGTLKAVFSVKGGIGYCFRSEYREGAVKILLVL